MSDKWISVEERLPEEFENILVCNVISGYVGDSYAVAYYKHGEFYPICDMLRARNYDGDAVIALDDEVTHWMPIEPPRFTPADLNGKSTEEKV